jgi:hypothetical protein
MGHFDALERDPRHSAVMDVVLDLRHVTSTPETSQIRQVAERVEAGGAVLQYGRCAVVAVAPEHVGMARLFVQFARDRFAAATVVATIENAEQWLWDPTVATEATG